MISVEEVKCISIYEEDYYFLSCFTERRAISLLCIKFVNGPNAEYHRNLINITILLRWLFNNLNWRRWYPWYNYTYFLSWYALICYLSNRVSKISLKKMFLICSTCHLIHSRTNTKRRSKDQVSHTTLKFLKVKTYVSTI